MPVWATGEENEEIDLNENQSVAVLNRQISPGSLEHFESTYTSKESINNKLQQEFDQQGKW